MTNMKKYIRKSALYNGLQVHWDESETRSVTDDDGETRNETVSYKFSSQSFIVTKSINYHWCKFHGKHQPSRLRGRIVQASLISTRKLLSFTDQAFPLVITKFSHGYEIEQKPTYKDEDDFCVPWMF